MQGNDWGLGDTSNWEPWFAWAPVRTIDGKKVWLKKIYRREFYPATPTLPPVIVQYITPKALTLLILQNKK